MNYISTHRVLLSFIYFSFIFLFKANQIIFIYHYFYISLQHIIVILSDCS